MVAVVVGIGVIVASGEIELGDAVGALTDSCDILWVVGAPFGDFGGLIGHDLIERIVGYAPGVRISRIRLAFGIVLLHIRWYRVQTC